jgi:DAACS family dicarboxylate/amino acid:cation (Na+ or H+) symporter
VIGVVCLAVLLGCALKNYQSHNEPWVEQWNRLAHGGYRLSETIITWLVTLTPVAVFGVIAKSVGESGLDKFQGLAAYVGVALLGLCIQTFVVYNLWLIFTKKVSLKDFWREASRPCLNAFGVNSSLATLPLTLKALDNLKVSKTSSRMAACIGTNLNNDGILLYEAMAAIIVTQALGMNLTISSQISIALVCVLTSLGIAGVPEAGIISLAIILSTLGIPNEIVTSFLAVDWIIARMRSVTNVVADMTSSIVIDHQSDKSQDLSTSS